MQQVLTSIRCHTNRSTDRRDSLPITEAVLFGHPITLGPLSQTLKTVQTHYRCGGVKFDGTLPVEGTPVSEPIVRQLYQVRGVHTLTVWAEDSTAKLGSASVSIQVGAPIRHLHAIVSPLTTPGIAWSAAGI